MAFRLFGFDVEIRLSFWLSTILLASGGNFDANTIKRIMVWTPVVLVSILVHELGHAFAIRWQRLQPSIMLYYMGGLTSWREVLPVSRGARIIISLGGPFAGFLLGAVVFGGVFVAERLGMPPLTGWLRVAYYYAIWVNFGWGLVNLMPVLPFDGGHVLEHALGPKRRRIALMVSAAVGIALCLYFLAAWDAWGRLWGAYLFGSAAASSVIALRGEAPVKRVIPTKSASDDGGAPLINARAALDADDPAAAIGIAQRVLESKPSEAVRIEANTIVVWAELMRSDTGAAERALMEIRRIREPDRALTGNLSLAAGRLSEARSILEKAYIDGDRRKEVFGPLIQVLLRQDAHARAAEVALERFDALSSDDARQVAELALEGRAYIGAAKLFERVGSREKSRADVVAAARAYAKGGEPGPALDTLRKAFVNGVVSETDVRGDSELGPLLGEAPGAERGA